MACGVITKKSSSNLARLYKSAHYRDRQNKNEQ
jgi:hypothetical protein